MSLHKLTAGSGYDYLTRQVAAADATSKGGQGLATYYTEKGETPGVWMGEGLDGIDGLAAGDEVTADQMQSLFGSGHHPLADQRVKELDLRIGRPEQTAPTPAEYKAATRLGTPFKVYADDVTPFQRQVAVRLAAFNQAAGLPGDWPVPAADRARIRTEVARTFFNSEHGREPADARELAATIAKHSRPKTIAVAGYDLTFSPVKSFSVMWALADRATAARLEQAHHQAVSDAITFIEGHALFTREGTNGVRQVTTRGLVATGFTHRDSRAGDPDLHTHVAIANKVQTRQGKWLAIDGQPLHKMVVAASEFYNARLEAHARDLAGVRFTERPNPDARKRPVREIVGIDADLCRHFSKRRADVEGRRTVLVADFQATHGRPPTSVETLHLAQQATLETREAKHEPRTIAEQRQAWMATAVEHQGSTADVAAMIHAAAHPSNAGSTRRPPVDTTTGSQWFTQTSTRVAQVMELARATWQDNHVTAEAWRRVKAADIPTDRQAEVASRLVQDVLTRRSVRLGRPPGALEDRIVEPTLLTRPDGTSVYTKAHTDLFTTDRVLAAERRLVDTAGLTGGRTVSEASVQVALLESAANGVTLNPGQVTLVREMATSGARVQLGIAPAGSGKTTAMKALATAWVEEGGAVIGLGPSAAAAAELGAQFQAAGHPGGTTSDTLAMLTYALDHGTALPQWAADVDNRTLVVIDEAGMADTISLDTAVQFVLARGGSVRLIGDDQQLAAIGAGGVLRDIRATHGALHLSELMRFTDQAEGAASLALREGRTEALGFYLDQQRIHVGDLATMTENVFTAWQTDRANGLDTIMLAPTRDLVATLNKRARADRLAQAGPDLDASADGPTRPTVRLADGNDASAGDVVITRRNERSLQFTRHDWVKNGDRWIVLKVTDTGGLRVRHPGTGRRLDLPAGYVAEHTNLGYACTVHTAQGVTADTMHGLLTGDESRQQLYTMLTRGRAANHAYLGAVGDGDPHSVIHPELLHPRTPTDVLERILASDVSPKSATTLQRETADPAGRLGAAAAAYTDAVYVAAEHTLGTEVVAALDEAVDRVVPGLSEEPAWPALRAHLLLLGAAGGDPVAMLAAAAEDHELATSHDTAAVLDWRLDPSGMRNADRGPLPWLPAVPDSITRNPAWGPYLAQRAELVAALADQVRDRAGSSTIAAPWATGGVLVSATLRGEVEVWRAATGVDLSDRRPTGPRQQQKAAGTWQRRLDRQLAGDHAPAVREWKHLLRAISPSMAEDELTPLLAERLAAISRAGLDAPGLLAAAAKIGPLPDDHAAAALWWRISRRVEPAVTMRAEAGEQVTTATWTRQLIDLIGEDRADRLKRSSWWPALVSVVDHGLQRGWALDRLIGLDRPGHHGVPDDLDECQAMVWRASIATSDIPTDSSDDRSDIDSDLPPDDINELLTDIAVERDSLWTEATNHQHPLVSEPGWIRLDDVEVPDDTDRYSAEREQSEHSPADDDLFESDTDDIETDRILLLAAMARDARVIDEKTFYNEADLRRMEARAVAWLDSPVSRDRMLEVNELTLQFFEHQLTQPQTWGRAYLQERLRTDLAGHSHFRPGHAPVGWDNLVRHLRSRGVTDEEMVAAGVATIASTGKLIDRFRDRVVFPITTTGANGPEVLGFVGRCHPDAPDNRTPKYLNTATTPLFAKGEQLFGAIQPLMEASAIPVIVEGPMDAIAVTISTGGTHVGVAPLGTALTDDQVTQLVRHFQQSGRDPIVATDGDLAGQVAAERDFWLLTGRGLDPTHVEMPPASDPAHLLSSHGPEGLSKALATPRPMGKVLLDERLNNLPPHQAEREAAAVIAALSSRSWESNIAGVAARLDIAQQQLRRNVSAAVEAWDADPRRAAAARGHSMHEVKARLQDVVESPTVPKQRWAGLAEEVDSRLVDQRDWHLLASMMQRIFEAGHDVHATVRRMVAEAPLDDCPARDLRHRLASNWDALLLADTPSYAPTRTYSPAKERREAKPPPAQQPRPARR